MTRPRRIALAAALPTATAVALLAFPGPLAGASAGTLAPSAVGPARNYVAATTDPGGGPYGNPTTTPAEPATAAPQLAPTAQPTATRRGRGGRSGYGYGYGVSPNEVPIPSGPLPATAPPAPPGGVSPGEVPTPGGQLPVTGAPIVMLAVGGGLLAAAGLAIRYGTRRRRGGS